MIETKISYKKVVLDKMNVPFVITLAVMDDGAVVDRILHTSAELIGRDLDEIDDKFSPLKLNSLISKFHRGDAEFFFQDSMFSIVYNQCAIAKLATDGGFNAFKNNRYDPRGILLGWAIETEFQLHLKPLLVDPAIVGVSLSAGSNFQVASRSSANFSWTIEIADPLDPENLLANYQIENGAISTASVKPAQLKADRTPLQATVLSHGLTEASVLATASLSKSASDTAQWFEDSRSTGLLVDDQHNHSAYVAGQTNGQSSQAQI